MDALRRALARCAAAAMLGALVLAGAVPPASGAPEGGAPEAGTPEAAAPAGGGAVAVADLEALLSALEDEAARETLAAQLRALIAARKAEAPETEGVGALALAVLSRQVEEISRSLAGAAGAVADAPELVRRVGDRMGDPAIRARALEIVVKLTIVLGLGLIAERLAKVLLWRARRAIEGREAMTGLMRVALLVGNAGLYVVPVLAFAAAAYGILPFTEPGPITRAVALAVINAMVLARAVLSVALIVLAPRLAALRLPALSDETAHYAFLWVRRLANVGIYGFFAAQAAFLLGLPEAGYAAILDLLGLVVAVMAVIVILQNRISLAEMIRGVGAEGADQLAIGLWNTRRLLADVWHVVAILYVVAIYLVWALGVEGGFAFVVTATALTVVILGAARLIDGVAGHAIKRGFSVGDELRGRFPTLEARANRYMPVLHGALKTVVYGIAVLAVLQVWGIEVFVWLRSDVGLRVVGGAVSIALVLAAALLAWEIASLFIESYLARVDADEVSTERGARLKTLLPLSRNVLLVLLLVMVTLIVLSELGINIAPLLAGAGVVGLAIGFGAQKLVQDVINGVFILVEDTIAVGDVVTLDGHSGLVEAMSIRSIRMRDLEGNVHTVPFSSVSTVLNRTKEFSFYLFNVGVAYREDVDEVIEVLTEIGAELQEDETYGPNILEPLEVLGLDSFADSAVIIKARIKTRPIKQWYVGREFNRRMKRRFDELGIEIPFPHQTVYFGEDKQGRAPPLRVRSDEAAEPKASTAAAEGEPSPRPVSVVPDPDGGDG